MLPLAFVACTVGAYRSSARERKATMPGDRMIPRPMFGMTHAVTIDAPPERVWPWIAQMGAGRGGWYSYDFIDNGGRPSASALLEPYQQVKQGDLFPAVPGAKDGFIVLAVEAPHDLVLGGPPDPVRGQRATWEFLLQPLQRGRTRLIVRVRAAEHWLSGSGARDPGRPRRFIERVYGFMAHLPTPVLKGFAGFGHRAMQNEQLRGLQRRAEGRWSG
ncbi:MAG TPA: hypothetical protein VFQ38_20105 [Longimicrobiales bacterium]|nr:hypothetical protein [Longimicrobiales bacterium]